VLLLLLLLLFCLCTTLNATVLDDKSNEIIFFIAVPAGQAAINALGLGLPQGWSHLCAYGVFVQYQWRVHGVSSKYMHETLANALFLISTGQPDLQHGS
jgi:hypothetical protein